ncbi:hypothetical protein WSM22_01540 [Cytophagales bacterium WSM2-2]|nr:hypothetical protein WSM22_01540 [Cytophagales bacterium WSM2-2]
MKKNILRGLLILGIAGGVISCSKENISASDSGANSTMLAVGQTASQLASGTSFTVTTTATGAAVDSSHTRPAPGHCKNGGMGSFLNGSNFLTPSNELVAIVDAESAGDMRGIRMSGRAGAKITNYDASGNVITLSVPSQGGPEGVSFSGGQFPQFDSLLKKIAKTEINFGSGVTEQHDSITITRVGKIVITRAKSGQQVTETITFDGYAVNGNKIEGTKTRTNSFDATTGQGSSTTTVFGGKITFNDGTVAAWSSSRERITAITSGVSPRKPASGTIVTTASVQVTSSDGTAIYSHNTTKPIVENVACELSRHWPVSGTVETDYRSQTVIVDFGDGSCSNRSITITINGVAITKTIGGN